MKTRLARAMAACVALAACGDDGDTTKDTTQPDTTTDTSGTPDGDTTTGPDDTLEPSDTGDTTGETTGETTTGTTGDTGPDGDTTSGRTVVGTAFENVGVSWDEPLDLCSGWDEGAPLANEKARKVRITIPVQARPSLDEDALAAARMDGVVIYRGPNAADRVAPDVSAQTTSLGLWQLTENVNADHLSVEIRHHLADGAGMLIEGYYASRVDGSEDPLAVVPESYEVRFGYQAAGSELQPVQLVRCGGAPGFEDAVSVAVATDGGKRWATLIRYWRTVWGVDAGSYPVVLVGHEIFTSDGIWWANTAWDFWAHTYVAQHHNFDDSSEVDFTRDLGLWHTFFRDPIAGETRVKRVELAGVLGGAPTSTMTIETQTGSTVESEVMTIPEPHAFRRIDAVELGRQLAEECSGGSVVAIGASEHRVQLMFCPDGADRDLVGVVPIIWMSEPTRSSKRVDTITAVDGGWDVAIGDFDMTIRAQGDDVYISEVRNPAGEVVTSSYDEIAPLAPPRPREETITASMTSPAVSMELHRRWAGFGVGKSQLWAPVRFTLTLAGVTRTVEAWDKLDYTNTHHNWEDELIATADDGYVIRWKVSFMNGVANEITVTDPDGTVVFGPTDVRDPR